MNDKNKQQLTEDEERERRFEAALRQIPVVRVLPKDWYDPEDDIYWDDYVKETQGE